MTEHDPDQLEKESHEILDARGLLCPEPVMLLHNVIKKIEAGGLVKILATDPSTLRDIPNFCQHLNHKLLFCSDLENRQQKKQEVTFWVRKRSA